jgi:outer membrane protein assembly factor BamB
VQPGGRASSLVALDPATGDMIWEAAGRKAAYAGLITAEIAGKTQIIGYDAAGLGGWDAATGHRQWELKPDTAGDFNVPTPLWLGDRLFVTTENNGARIYAFDQEGRIQPKPVATFAGLSPDAHTPVVVGSRLIGLHQSLHCLDAKSLKPIWAHESTGLGEYATLISDGKSRVLALGENGVLALYETGETALRELGKLPLLEEDAHILAHPALVGNRLYLRLGKRAVCLVLADTAP